MKTKTVQGQKELPKKITVLAGDCGRDYIAQTGREAIQMFFRDIIGGRIKLCQLSPIGSWLRDDGEEIPFRIALVLMLAGKMTIDEVDATFRRADLELTRKNCCQWRKQMRGCSKSLLLSVTATNPGNASFC